MLLRIQRWQVGIPVLAVFACSDPGPTGPPVQAAPPAPAMLTALTGTSQVGKAGEVLPESFGVQVSDETGRGVGNVTIAWSVTAGDGLFKGGSFTAESRSATTATNSQGYSSVAFTPTVIGPTVVRAAIPGSAVLPAKFSVEATTFLIAFVRTWGGWDYPDFWGMRFEPPCGDCDAVVPVGTTVEWFNRRFDWWNPADWRVVAVSAPPGGELFNSGPLVPEARFEFVPEVAGTWEYVGPSNSDGSTVKWTLTAR
ncbi:MAG TPA: hypothetical protein VFZ56_08685 [Gemmatimonadaceae bacterium]